MALGQNALSSLVNGQANVAVGWDAGYNIIAGVGNIAIGYKAAFQNTSGSANISIGQNVHSTLATGSNNVAVGYYAGAAVSTISNTTFIGSLAGRYETAANSIMIDSIERTNLAGGRAGSTLLRGHQRYGCQSDGATQRSGLDSNAAGDVRDQQDDLGCRGAIDWDVGGRRHHLEYGSGRGHLAWLGLHDARCGTGYRSFYRHAGSLTGLEFIHDFSIG